jgi:hypothetical protein
MAPERLSWLQTRILSWLMAEDQRLRGTMAGADHLRPRTLDHGAVGKLLKEVEAP